MTWTNSPDFFKPGPLTSIGPRLSTRPDETVLAVKVPTVFQVGHLPSCHGQPDWADEMAAIAGRRTGSKIGCPGPSAVLGGSEEEGLAHASAGETARGFASKQTLSAIGQPEDFLKVRRETKRNLPSTTAFSRTGRSSVRGRLVESAFVR